MPLALLLVNCPDAATADTIADALMAGRLAACTNRYPPIESRYRWRGEIETAAEHPLLVKTGTGLVDAATQEIRRLHPFEVPAILHLAADAGADYLAWIGAETGAQP